MITRRAALQIIGSSMLLGLNKTDYNLQRQVFLNEWMVFPVLKPALLLPKQMIQLHHTYRIEQHISIWGVLFKVWFMEIKRWIPAKVHNVQPLIGWSGCTLKATWDLSHDHDTPMTVLGVRCILLGESLE
jgi:hypothetical protein